MYRILCVPFCDHFDSVVILCIVWLVFLFCFWAKLLSNIFLMLDYHFGSVEGGATSVSSGGLWMCVSYKPERTGVLWRWILTQQKVCACHVWNQQWNCTSVSGFDFFIPTCKHKPTARCCRMISFSPLSYAPTWHTHTHTHCQMHAHCLQFLPLTHPPLFDYS